MAARRYNARRDIREIEHMGHFGVMVATGTALYAAAVPAVWASSKGNPPIRLDCPAIAGETLVYIDIYDGPPDDKADLVPDQHHNAANTQAWNTWELYQNPERIWVQCGYGRRLEGPYSRTEYIMLPETAKNCRADFRMGPKPTDVTLQKFFCR
ncbi:MAG TPA: STY0301 family protein [Stellaceae bacterium]